MFLKCPTKSKVPPITKIQDKKPEEPALEFVFEDLPSEDEIFAPPPIILQRDDDRSHDDVDHQQLPHLPPPGDAPGEAPSQGTRKSGQERKEPYKEGNISLLAHLQIQIAIENCLQQAH